MLLPLKLRKIVFNIFFFDMCVLRHFNNINHLETQVSRGLKSLRNKDK